MHELIAVKKFAECRFRSDRSDAFALVDDGKDGASRVAQGAVEQAGPDGVRVGNLPARQSENHVGGKRTRPPVNRNDEHC